MQYISILFQALHLVACIMFICILLYHLALMAGGNSRTKANSLDKLGFAFMLSVTLSTYIILWTN